MVRHAGGCAWHDTASRAARESSRSGQPSGCTALLPANRACVAFGRHLNAAANNREKLEAAVHVFCFRAATRACSMTKKRAELHAPCAIRTEEIAMPRFAANLTMMFTEFSFLERFSAAADQGFEWVECLFPYDFEPEALARALERNGLKQALFNLPSGDWQAGERGLACLPGREKEFEASVEKAVLYAKALQCPRVHVMAGNRPLGADATILQNTYLGNVRRAAQRLADDGLELCLEPINRYSMPRYFLRSQEQAVGYLHSLDLPNARLQFDFFHCQMQEGNVCRRLRNFFPFIGHCQIAGVPERHEPDQGELNFPFFFRLLDELGYAGVVGCEYNPAGKTVDGLGWIRAYGVVPSRC